MRDPSKSLFPDEPELASDLEWMLQSGQVPPAELAAELARSYFEDLQRWMGLLFDDPEQADYISLKAILAAALNAYRLPGGTSSRVWVFQQAARMARRSLKASHWRWRWGFIWKPWRQASGYSLPDTYLDAALWIAIDQLPDESRLAAGLAWCLSFDVVTIAQIIGQPELEIDRMLAQAIRSSLNSLTVFGLRLDDLPEQALDLTIRESLARRSVQLQSGPLDVESLASEISREIQHLSGRQSLFVRWKEFTWLVIVAAVILGLFWVVNWLLPEEQPDLPAAGASSTETTEGIGVLPFEVLRLDYYAQPGETVDEIGRNLGLPPEEINQLQATYSTGHLDLASPIRIELAAPEHFPESTPVVPVAHRQPSLTMNSSPLEIRNLMNISPTLWKTLWLDAVMFDYGPDGYVGSPHQYRIQSWYSQPDLSLTVKWISGSDNTYSILRKNGLRYTSYQQGWLDVRRDGSDFVENQLTEDMVFPNHSLIFGRPGRMRVVGEDQVAGRPVIVVDWRTDDETIWPDRYRMWVDIRTGMVLRYQFYSGQEGDTLLGEVIIAKLALDIDFPQADLFTPWNLQQQVFVSDYRGDQVDASVLPAQTSIPENAQRSQERQSPPPGFDLASSRISFQYEIGLRPSNRPSNVTVFADQYFLGDIQLSDPWSVYCFRSPDGRKVAYSFNPYGGPLIGSGWFELKAPLQVMTGAFRRRYGIFAFASDNRHLAFFGRDPIVSSPGSLTIIDTETGQERFLAYFNNIISMFWSPDNSQIAILAAPDDWWSQMDAIIIDASNGKELYRTEIDQTGYWNSASRSPDWPASNWPGRDWDKTFPQIKQGLSMCVSSPP